MYWKYQRRRYKSMPYFPKINASWTDGKPKNFYDFDISFVQPYFSFEMRKFGGLMEVPMVVTMNLFPFCTSKTKAMKRLPPLEKRINVDIVMRLHRFRYTQVPATMMYDEPIFQGKRHGIFLIYLIIPSAIFIICLISFLIVFIFFPKHVQIEGGHYSLLSDSALPWQLKSQNDHENFHLTKLKT